MSSPMDLHCDERLSSGAVGSQGARAPDDRQMLEDPRVLANLLALETSSIPACDYLEHVQEEMQPFMRKVVTTWMLEVCEEQNCENQIFPLAVNYLDRFLCTRSVPRSQLQLLASAALLVASKFRQCESLPVLLLCAYTDYSITADDLRTWELLLLQRLEWQISSVTACDLIDHVLARCTSGATRAMLRRHAHTLASLCYTETELLRLRPSLLAAAAIISAARGLTRALGGAAPVAELSASVSQLTCLSAAAIEPLVAHVEMIFARETAPERYETTSNRKPGSPPPAAEPSSAPTTPTHVLDVQF